MNIEKRSSLIKLSLLFVLLLSGLANGQETTGGIEGVVKDPAGALVPNVTVTTTSARSAATGTTTTGIGYGFRRTVTTNDEGFQVKFFKPDGTGPFYALLPHGSFPGRPLVRTYNPDERGGRHESWWSWHPDITGKTGEF